MKKKNKTSNDSVLQRFLVPLFIFIWWNRLHEPSPWNDEESKRMKVIKVKGWRTALVASPYGRGRSTITFMFNWEQT